MHFWFSIKTKCTIEVIYLPFHSFHQAFPLHNAICVCACIQSSSRANSCIVPAESWVLESETETLEWRQETSLRLVLMHGRRPKLVSMVANTAGFDGGQPSGSSELSVIFLSDLNLTHLPKDICLLSWKFVCKYMQIHAHPAAAFDCWVFTDTYISCWPFFILSNTALQVKQQVMTADQDSFPKLLFKLLHIKLNGRKV